MKKLLLLSLIIGVIPSVYADNSSLRPGAMYFGLQAGYGGTNWSRITVKDNLLKFNLPDKSEDTGPVVGFFTGINIGHHYGVELDYKRYKNSKICFANNIYKPQPFCMVSRTQNVSLLGKLRIAIGKRAEIYSVMGATYIMRRDTLTHKKAFGGVFGAGVNIGVAKHIVNGLEFDFATGKAGINEVPAKSYVPFLTSINYRVAFYT